MVVIHKREDLVSLAKTLVASLRAGAQATVVTLSGDLGVGKTSLTQELARVLGVREQVSSPTFVIAKYYDLRRQAWRRLIHLDAYRLEGEPLEPLGLGELLSDPHNLVVIEWPEYVEALLPQERTEVSLALAGEGRREVSIRQGSG